MTPTLTGHCLCGRITYRAEAAPLWQMHCHCESCRRATASGFTSFFAIADGFWRWTGDEAALFRSSPGVVRRFCATCGSPMAYRTDAAPERPESHAPTAAGLQRGTPALSGAVRRACLALIGRGAFRAAQTGSCSLMTVN